MVAYVVGFFTLAVMHVVAQNSTDSNSTQWLNSLFLVPSVEVQNELANSQPVNLSPAKVAEESCVNELGKTGVCVLHYQCQPSSRSLIKDGATILDVRENDSPCPNVLEVCCMHAPIRDNSVGDSKENTRNNAIRNKCMSLLFAIVLLLKL